jgi:hypothetical protein
MFSDLSFLRIKPAEIFHQEQPSSPRSLLKIQNGGGIFPAAVVKRFSN